MTTYVKMRDDILAMSKVMRKYQDEIERIYHRIREGDAYQPINYEFGNAATVLERLASDMTYKIDYKGLGKKGGSRAP